MTKDEILELWKAQPFRPFIIHVADGRSFSVPHPDFVFLAGGGRTIIVNSLTSDSFNIIDVLLVTRLEVLGSNTSVSNSGASQQLS